MKEEDERTTWKDPIVEDVHEARAAIWNECGGTIEGLFREIRRREEEARSAGRVILDPPTKEPPHASAR